jgi:hypothetical protein
MSYDKIREDILMFEQMIGKKFHTWDKGMETRTMHLTSEKGVRFQVWIEYSPDKFVVKCWNFSSKPVEASFIAGGGVEALKSVWPKELPPLL